MGVRPGLLLIGLGLGVMLTPSVNMVQSCFPESQQGEISGLSRSVSNLGSSLGTAVAGTILVSGLSTGAYATAMVALAVVGVAAWQPPPCSHAATRQRPPPPVTGHPTRRDTPPGRNTARAGPGAAAR